MQVRVLYFGLLKDALARSSEDIDLPSGATVSDLRRAYQDRIPEGSWKVMAVAVNQEYAGDDVVLFQGDEAALLPPVSGG